MYLKGLYEKTVKVLNPPDKGKICVTIPSAKLGIKLVPYDRPTARLDVFDIFESGT